MADIVKKVFMACDKDQDGYLDRSDLEEVRKQLGLEGNISEIFEQFGAGNTGKISFNQFSEHILFADHTCSESSPEYCSTDSENSAPPPSFPSQRTVPMASEKGRKKEDTRKETQYRKNAFDEELKASEDKMKEIAETFKIDPNFNPHRKSGGGFEDYLDEKTLARLEELKIIDPHSSCDKPYIDHQPSSAFTATKQKIGLVEDFSEAGCTTGPDYLEMSKKLHLAALTSYKNEIFELNSRLNKVRLERDQLRKQQSVWNIEKQKMQKDFEERLQSQTMRITELQSVIAELTRKLKIESDNKIIEEDEEEEEEEEDARSRSTSDLENQGSRACSECSDEHCDCGDHIEDEGPNQVNFLATTNEATRSSPKHVAATQKKEAIKSDAVDGDNNDLQMQLHRVLGALESNIELRKQNKSANETERSTVAETSEADLERNFLEEAHKVLSNQSNLMSPDSIISLPQINELVKQIEILKKEKRELEKQLHDMSVQGYVYQEGNTSHVEEEFSKLRQENNYLRSKLRKSEQELDEVKASNITYKEEKERLRKKNRLLQDSVGSSRESETFIEPQHGGHRRSHSTHIDRPMSPIVQQRSSSVAAERSVPQRSNSINSGSPTLNKRASSDTRSSPSSSLGRPPKHASSFTQVNSKGYTVSPDNSLRRGQHFADHSSDLGSSIGDESQRNILLHALVRNLRGKIPEELLQTLMAYNSLDSILRHLVNHFVAEVEEKKREGMINVERLESRMGHLQSQKDLLQLSLHESKQNAEKLSLLCGQYESNSTAWSLALKNTEELIETYEVMLQLQESEADNFARNCQAIGIVGNFDTIKSLTSTKSSQSNISIASSSSHVGFEDEEVLKSYHNKRKDLESQAKNLLHQLDKKYDYSLLSNATQDHDELSYKSRTSTGSSVNSTCTDTLSKDEEHRLRDYIKRLKSERNTYRATVCDKLESVHEYSDPPAEGSVHSERSEKTHDLNMDIETAVVLQDMQALKEERAELKHRIYLLEKEKKALELKMNARDAQEQAYVVHIEHLKSEVKEQMKKRKQLQKEHARTNGAQYLMEDESLSMTSGSTQSNHDIPQYSSAEEIPNDLKEASRRERKLKQRITELVNTLDTLSKNSEIRHKQTNEYISDLKRANGALVTAYEKAKKKHASRLKKFEQQLVQMADKYQSQVRHLKERINVLIETPPATAQTPQTETSL